MSYNAIQKNLERIIKDKNYQIADLERKSGLKKNSIYNIVKGISKKPSANILQAVSHVLKINVEDLFKASLEVTHPLTKQNLILISKTAKVVIDEIIALELKLTFEELIGIIDEAYNYIIASDPEEQKPDERFIKWFLKQKFLI